MIAVAIAALLASEHAAIAAPPLVLEATYRVESDGRCPIRRLHVRLDGADGGFRIAVTAAAEDRELFAFGVQARTAGILSARPGAALPDMERYVFRAAGRPALDYRRPDGRPLLPAFAFDQLLPRVLADGPAIALADSGSYLGYRLERETEEAAAFPPEAAAADTVTLVLDPDLLVATGVATRDDGTPRARGRRGDYRYVDLGADDYRVMREAGFNLFRVPARDIGFVLEEPVFFTLTENLEKLPGLLYRSNFHGCVLYMDEPAAGALMAGRFATARTPGEAAAEITEITRQRWQSRGGRLLLPRLLEYAGFGVGNCGIVQDNYPVWEAVESAAWYELAAGVPGWCYEARLHPADWSHLVKKSLGVSFPSDVDACLRYHFALMTGAARQFRRPWGVSVYGQMEPSAADRLFPLAYDLGATYFWVWTTDRDHHVPFRRQLELAHALRRHAAESPRRLPPDRITAGARVAVVLPWGYACDQFSLGVYGPARMWGSEFLALGNPNPLGVPYREVLAAAVRRCVQLLDDGQRFDVVFWKGGEATYANYDTVFRIGEDGRERVESGSP